MGKQVCYMGVRDVNCIRQCGCMFMFIKMSINVCVLSFFIAGWMTYPSFRESMLCH